MSNYQLPVWYNDYMKHYEFWNCGFTQLKGENMCIYVIPKNNKYTVKDHLEIMDKLKKKISLSRYKIELLKKAEGGFQLSHPDYEIKTDFELQIRSNIHPADVKFLKNKDNINKEIVFPTTKLESGINILQFLAHEKVPRKIMLYLYQILEEDMGMMIYQTNDFPHKDDMIIWGTMSIWHNKLIKNPNYDIIKLKDHVEFIDELINCLSSNAIISKNFTDLLLKGLKRLKDKGTNKFALHISNKEGKNRVINKSGQAFNQGIKILPNEDWLIAKTSDIENLISKVIQKIYK